MSTLWLSELLLGTDCLAELAVRSALCLLAELCRTLLSELANLLLLLLLLVQRVDDSLGHGGWGRQVIALRLETVLIGNVFDGDQLAIGRGVRIGADLHQNILLLIAKAGTIVVEFGENRLFSETGTFQLDAVAGLVTEMEWSIPCHF